MVEEKIHYFKRNVNHSISVRFYKGDRDGAILNVFNPIVEIEASKLKAFKDVNKSAILNGLLVEINEPEESWETPNALTDDDINSMVGSIQKVKKAIATIDSIPILYKILEAATEKNSSKTIIKLIEDRLDEVQPSLSESLAIDRQLMGGTYDEI